MSRYYQILYNAEDNHFELFRGDALTIETGEPLATAPSAIHLKAQCFRDCGEIAVRVYHDEELFDTTNPLHLALARIEGRHSTAAVVAVGSTHYLIRRSRFGVEVPVRYTKDATSVTARGDYEELP